jgi:hypothetical protein
VNCVDRVCVLFSGTFVVVVLQVKLIKVGDGWIKLTDGVHFITGTLSCDMYSV